MKIKLTKFQINLVKKEIKRLQENKKHIGDGDHWGFIHINDEIENLEEAVRTKKTFINNTYY